MKKPIARPFARRLRETCISRRALCVSAAGLLVPQIGHAQVIQRARQIRERRACVENQPDCRPEIRAQLEAERFRIRTGLSALTVGAIAAGALMWRRRRSEQRAQDQQLSHLHDRVAEISRKKNENQAKSDHDE